MSLLSSLISNVMGQSASDPKPEVASDSLSLGGVDSESDGATGHEGTGCSLVEPLEWKFVDFSKATRSPIFDVDPVMLKKFIGHNVTVLSVSREQYQGCCLAIDPVSLSVILAKRISGGGIRVVTLPGYFLSKITVDANSVPAINSVSVNDLDVAELYHAPNGQPENNEADSGAIKGKISTESASVEYTQEEVQKRQQKLIELLSKHRMPCTVTNDVLEIPGGVRIRPPYTNECCDTSNKMIKKKLKELIESL